MVDVRARVLDDEAERRAWYEILELVRSLTSEERLAPGYWRDPDWSVRDVLGHLGTWFAEAEVQLERIAVGTYEGHDVDIDALNAAFLEAMHDQPWEVAWLQANAGRTKMVERWSATTTMADEAAWWVRKSGTEHYLEHLDRLREWVDELRRRRADRGLTFHTTATSERVRTRTRVATSHAQPVRPERKAGRNCDDVRR